MAKYRYAANEVECAMITVLYIHNRTIGHVWPHPRAINIRASLGILCVVVTAVDIFKTRSMNRTARLSI